MKAANRKARDQAELRSNSFILAPSVAPKNARPLCSACLRAPQPRSRPVLVAPKMDVDSDEEYDRVSDYNMSDLESEPEVLEHQTPNSTPPIHTPRSSAVKTIPCPYNGCQKTFNRNARLQEHVRSHTNTRIFRCPYPPCTREYLRDSHLKHHVKSAHSGVRDYSCTWEGCDKSFVTGTRLRRHLAAHEGREKYKCRGYDGCNESFRKHETLKRHIATVHEQPQMMPYPCVELNAKTGQQCTKAFETADKLRAHARSMHDRTKFSCSECLIQNARIQVEPEVHDGQGYVEAYFATFAELQAHMIEFHPPTCEHCSTAFKTQKELTRHFELQHGIVDENAAPVQKFNCTHPGCGRSFTKKGNLNVHLKTVHEKRREFVCGETEISISEDIEHDVEIHGCGRDFTSKASLEEHVRTVHLGLGSRRVERNKKRKAEREDDDDDDVSVKPRRPRKDKGIRKTYPVLQSVAGMPTGYAPAKTLDQDMYDDHANEHTDYPSYLSSSMTMLGNHIYHNGQQYDVLTPSQSFTTVSGMQNDLELDPYMSNYYDAESHPVMQNKPLADEGQEMYFDGAFGFDPIDPMLAQL